MRRIVLPSWFALCLAGLVASSGAQPELPLRDDVVAVVLADAGLPRGSITISYPKTVSRAQAEQDLAAMQSVSDWRFSPPSIEVGNDETQATAIMRPAAHSSDAYGDPVWPVVVALKRFSRVTTLVMGQEPIGGPAKIKTPYVEGTSSGQGGIWCYDIHVTDRSFDNISDLRRSSAEADTGNEARGQPLQRSHGWYILSLLVVLVSAVTYVVATRLAGPTRRRPRH